MRKLAKLMQRKQSVDVALDKMDELGYDTDKILSRFTKLGISPVPLWKNFCAQTIPGPVQILQNISAGGISIEYTKKKYR